MPVTWLYSISEGDISLWTDETDVTVDERLLAEYCAAFKRWPAAVYYGGTITPWFEKPPPSWVVTNQEFLQGMLVTKDCGTQERPFVRGEQPFGANMAFHRSVFSSWRFDPKLGLHGSDRIVGEERALITFLQERDASGIWVPRARVRHFVPAQRLTKDYLWKFWYGLGQTNIRTYGVPAEKLWRKAPRWLYRRYVEQKGNYYWQRLLSKSTWPIPYGRAAEARGAIHECRAQLTNR